jgi:hypothetical protein
MTPARARYAGYRFPAEIIGHAVWLYFRFPLGLRMMEELFPHPGDQVACLGRDQAVWSGPAPKRGAPRDVGSSGHTF